MSHNVISSPNSICLRGSNDVSLPGSSGLRPVPVLTSVSPRVLFVCRRETWWWSSDVASVVRTFFNTHVKKHSNLHSFCKCWIFFANAGYFSSMLHLFRQCCIFFANAGHIRRWTPCLGHLAWEILPGRSCLGPWARAHGPRPWAMKQRLGPGGPWERERVLRTSF